MIFKIKDNEKNPKETREEKFKRVAGRRVKEILNKMRLLRNCADKSNYFYSDEQIRKIISALKEELKMIELEFNKNKSKHRRFSL